MIKLYDTGAYLIHGRELIADSQEAAEQRVQRIGAVSRAEAQCGTMTYAILNAHNQSSSMQELSLQFDALASHDLTYVGVIQTAKASGLTQFPMPYILTNCHNSLCAVGGTLNEDDHMFGLSAAQKYGGIFVPAHQAVIHSYMREKHATCGGMVLGSDSHTRYGALGTLAIGEGGGELAKQLLNKTYDIAYPEVICVYLTGKVQPGVGPQDVALSIIGAVFENGYVKNKVMEFVGDGIAGLSADFRSGIDVMTTETACLSSIWETDDVILRYYAKHGRPLDYQRLQPQRVAWYDGVVYVDLSKIEPMIALPFHPSNVYSIRDFREHAADILHEVERQAKELSGNASIEFSLRDKLKNGQLQFDQGVVAGCAGGTYENIVDVCRILGNSGLGNDAFALSVFPGSQPIMLELTKRGMVEQLLSCGALVRSAFCGPCFGAGDVPFHGGLSARHTTRNFPNREGSKPTQGQMAAVALMDARSIAATAVCGGILTPATDLDVDYKPVPYHFDDTMYKNRVYQGFGNPMPSKELRYGPNIVDWPEMGRMEEHLLLGIASVIHDPVTTTDELIPSGDTSTYRSNPIGMAEFTLSRKDPAYVGRAKQYQQLEAQRRADTDILPEVMALVRSIPGCEDASLTNTGIGSLIYAQKPGDGSAREQAASCQRVLGGCANIAQEYATKRYRSNLINWGILPLLARELPPLQVDDYIFLPGIRAAMAEGAETLMGYLLSGRQVSQLNMSVGQLSETEREILLAGCLINYYKQ